MMIHPTLNCVLIPVGLIPSVPELYSKGIKQNELVFPMKLSLIFMRIGISNKTHDCFDEHLSGFKAYFSHSPIGSSTFLMLVFFTVFQRAILIKQFINRIPTGFAILNLQSAYALYGN